MSSEPLSTGYRVITVDEAADRFGLSGDLDLPYYRKVGGRQAIRLYEADQHVDGDLVMRDWVGDDLCPYSLIVDGDVTVGGDLVHHCHEGIGYFFLVTGNVTARNMLMSGFPHVLVRGDLTAANGILGQKGDDGGFLTVRGRTSAKVIVNALYFTMTFAEQPAAVVVGDADHTHCAVDFDDHGLEGVLVPELLVDYGYGDVGYCDTDEIEKALTAGRPVLLPGVEPRRGTRD